MRSSTPCHLSSTGSSHQTETGSIAHHSGVVASPFLLAICGGIISLFSSLYFLLDVHSVYLVGANRDLALLFLAVSILVTCK